MDRPICSSPPFPRFPRCLLSSAPLPFLKVPLVSCRRWDGVDGEAVMMVDAPPLAVAVIEVAATITTRTGRRFLPPLASPASPAAPSSASPLHLLHLLFSPFLALLHCLQSSRDSHLSATAGCLCTPTAPVYCHTLSSLPSSRLPPSHAEDGRVQRGGGQRGWRPPASAAAADRGPVVTPARCCDAPKTADDHRTTGIGTSPQGPPLLPPPQRARWRSRNPPGRTGRVQRQRASGCTTESWGVRENRGGRGAEGCA